MIPCPLLVLVSVLILLVDRSENIIHYGRVEEAPYVEAYVEKSFSIPRSALRGTTEGLSGHARLAVSTTSRNSPS